MATKKKIIKNTSLVTQLRTTKKDLKEVNLQLDDAMTQIDAANNLIIDYRQSAKDYQDNISARAKEHRHLQSVLNRVHEAIRSRFKAIQPDSKQTRNPFLPGSPEWHNLREVERNNFEFDGMSIESRLLKYLLDEVLEVPDIRVDDNLRNFSRN